MRNIDKLFVALGYVVVGLVTINFVNVLFFSNPTEYRRTISMAELMEGIKFLNAAARERCTGIARQRLQRELGDPSDAVSDGRRLSTLTWQSGASQPGTIVCNYEMGAGVTKLTIDDRVIFETSVHGPQ